MPQPKLKVYIAGPYTKGDPAVNTGNMCRVFNELRDLGFFPFCPLWSHFQHTFFPRPYEDWLEWDFEWILACDLLLRLPGESSGADKEVAFATEHGIPVSYTLDGLEYDRQHWRPTMEWVTVPDPE